MAILAGVASSVPSLVATPYGAQDTAFTPRGVSLRYSTVHESSSPWLRIATRPSLEPLAATRPYSCGANSTPFTLLSCRSTKALMHFHWPGGLSR